MTPFNSSVPAPAQLQEPAWWFVFHGHRLLVNLSTPAPHLPFIPTLTEWDIPVKRWQHLGQFEGVHCYSAECEETAVAPAGWQFMGLRQLFGQLPEQWMKVAGRAVQMMAWDRDHQFCGRCGTPTTTATDRAKVCPACDTRAYPRLSPAVIMLVQKEDKLLLAHGSRQPAGMFSVLAGFVEPGETLEETVQREVKEEVGLEVTNIRYFGSQPWPFPNSLMLGFICDYAGGEICLEDNEIEEAGWYTAADVRSGKIFVPPAEISIAGQLIQWFVQQHK